VFFYVFNQASDRGSIVLTTMMLIVFLGAAVNGCASASRNIWAFARDGGTPWQAWLSKVHDHTVPRNAVYFTCIIAVLLALVNIGSSIAFNAILSLQLLALMSTYCISIGCVLYKRVTEPGSLPPAQFSLGRWGVAVNGVGFVYSFFVLFWAGWPEQQSINAVTLNWAPVMFGATLVFSLVYYIFQGHKTYAGPVVLVRPAND